MLSQSTSVGWRASLGFTLLPVVAGLVCASFSCNAKAKSRRSGFRKSFVVWQLHLCEYGSIEPGSLNVQLSNQQLLPMVIRAATDASCRCWDEETVKITRHATEDPMFRSEDPCGIDPYSEIGQNVYQ